MINERWITERETSASDMSTGLLTLDMNVVHRVRHSLNKHCRREKCAGVSPRVRTGGGTILDRLLRVARRLAGVRRCSVRLCIVCKCGLSTRSQLSTDERWLEPSRARSAWDCEQ